MDLLTKALTQAAIKKYIVDEGLKGEKGDKGDKGDPGDVSLSQLNEVKDELTDVKADFTKVVTINDGSWEIGSYNYPDGANYASTSRIRLTKYVGYSLGYLKINALTGYEFSVYAWDASTKEYVGAWMSSNTFAKNGTLKWVSTFDLSNYDGYIVKVALRNASSPTSAMTTDLCINCTFALSKIYELRVDVDGVRSDLSKVYNGGDGITLLTKSTVIEKYGKYSASLLYLAADRLVGKVFPSEIPTVASTGAYAMLIDVEGLTSIVYPKFKNASGYGCLILDSNYTVLRNLPNITDETGTISTVTLSPNDKYFLFSVNKVLGETDWTLTLTGTPTKGLVTIAEDLDAISADVDANKNAITNLRGMIASTPNLDAEIVGFICYGQSWSMGYDTNAIVSTQRYDNLMLDSGLMNDPVSDLVVSANSFSPLTEKTVYTSTENTTRCGETPCTAQTDIIKQLLFNENGYDTTDIKYQIFSASPGMGNKSLEELAYGTDYYNRLIDVVRTANDLVRAQGKVFVVPAISWAQGRATNGDATYYDQLEELRVHLDTDIKAITGQTIPVKLIAWQAVFGNTTPKRFYDRYVYASEKYENIICSGTFYNYDHVANNNLHLTANSQDWLGTQFGIAYKRSIIDGEKFIPLKPKKAEVYGNIVYVDFYVPVKPLTFDTTLVAEATNKGFQIIDANSTEKNITAVEIVSPDRVKLVCSSDVASTDHIVYGNVGGTDYSPTTGKRGNLRDSQDIVYKDHNNVDLPCYNWCVVFDKTIEELTPST